MSIIISEEKGTEYSSKSSTIVIVVPFLELNTKLALHRLE